MAGEPILIVDDTPVNLKLTRILLVNEGYKVLTAASAEEALDLLRSYHPQLILADIQLPGMDGLELTRRLKRDDATRDIMVVALTAFAMKGDEQRAVDAGCDGYITKPIDTRALGKRIREYLERREEPSPAPVAEPHGLPAAELQTLRRRFLEEGQAATREWLLSLDLDFNANDAVRKTHQWIGAAGLLGYSSVARLAREVEAILHERPLDTGQLRDSLTNLALAFSTPREARDEPVPDSIIQALDGKRVALAGLPASERQRLFVALERAHAIAVMLDPADLPGSDAVQSCDLLVVHVGPPERGAEWLRDAVGPLAGKLPILYVGDRDDLLELDPAAQAFACEYLMDAWEMEEALVRLTLAFSERGGYAPRRGGLQLVPGRPQIVIADDDPTVLALVRGALQNFGMDCHLCEDGVSALEMVKRVRPHAAVLDVNMPGHDGYELLSLIRAENMPVRVLLLTARQQENDVIRGFTLGADDYVVKPFSPMELVARLKRLLGR
jgi:two-component system, cell cycle response regulator DivK